MPKLKAKKPKQQATTQTETAKPAKAVAVVPELKKSALSVDFGPVLVAGLARVNDDLEKATFLVAGANKKRYDLLAGATHNIMKAARADSSIDLTAALKQGPDGSKAKATLNDQIYLALGIKHVVTVTKGNATIKKLNYHPSVAQYFPSSSDVKGTPEANAKATLRTNLATQLAKCELAALGIIERGIDAKMDKKEGTLLLSGPAIKKEFGASSVLLNEKQKVQDGKKEITLTQKPSFAAIAALSAKAHGLEMKRGRAAGGGASIISPEKALAELANSVVTACERIKQPNDEQIKSLEKMRSAIDKVLD